MSRIKTVWQVSLYLLALAFATTALSADAPKPSGKVSITSTSIAAGIGVSWGDGTLNFNGKDYKFSIQGLTLVDFGISKAASICEVKSTPVIRPAVFCASLEPWERLNAAAESN